jgi:MinD-like ATPase involved in chromosome partitioning or flagellar assembly
VLNRHDSQVGISASDAESALAHPIGFKIASRGREMATTLNIGTPIVLSHPNSDVTRSIIGMAESLLKKLDGK